MTVEVSIVIVNYNVKDLLLTCITSFGKFHKGKLEYEIIVVDNASTDGSKEALKSTFPEILIIANANNRGFPSANNQGFAIARGKYIFMLNPDTEFMDDSVFKLYSYCEAQVEAMIVAPKLLNTDKTFQQSVWRYPNLRTIFCETHYLNFLLNHKNYKDKSFDVPFEAESFSGAAIFFRKDILEMIGDLDETMFWIEDVEFCYRAHKAGLKLMYYPQAQIIHHIGQSAKKNYTVSLSNQVFNKIKFFRKHYNKIRWFLVICLSFYHCLFKLIVFSILSPFSPVFFKKAKAYLYTIPRVFNPPVGIE